MKRIVKKADVRRLEIIHIAEKLFATQGYTHTSVENIIKEAGIAKGTFYHYFKAKKDVLTALVDHISSELESYYNSIIAMKDLTAIEKLKLMISGKEKQTKINLSVMKLIHKPENREIQEQLNIYSIKIIAPLIGEVLEQGNHEGIFKAKTPIESAQLILAASQFVLNSGLFNWNSQKQTALLKALQDMLELITGTKAGTFNFITKK